MSNDPSEVKDLIPLDFFQKPQDYTLFSYIVENIGHIIDDLELKSTMILIGAGMSDGGNYKGTVFATGYYKSTENLICKDLIIAGKSDFEGIVVVDGKSTVAGKSNFKNYVIFGGKSKIAGKSFIDKHLISSGKLTLDGEISINGDIYADNNITLKGIIEAENIRTTSLIYAQKELYISGDITAEEFIFTKGGGEVNSIHAKVVSIGFKDKRTAQLYYKKAAEKRGLVNPVKLLKYITGLVKHAFSSPKRVNTFRVNGSIVADEIYLSNCIIDGDVQAKIVIIGQNVDISGQISYTEKFEITEMASGEYKSNHIDTNQLVNND